MKQYLRRINSSKSVNSEDYPPWVTKLCYEDLCVPITDIVNQSLQEAKYPTLYKQAEITPVPKHNSPASPKDYRPISLLWHVGKVAENFINKQLRAFLLPKLHSNQFAYMDGVGCTDALVSLLDDVTRILDNDENIGSQLILYDFSKAFDMMQHSLLLSKLRRFDIPKPMIHLIADYLTGRVQCVHLKQHKTRSATTKCDVGVPQGTLLGPTLWLAFVDSLQFQHGISIKYADDTSTLLPLPYQQTETTTNTPTAISFLPSIIGQALIDECHRWSCDNQMQLNACKTKVVNISLRKSLNMIGTYLVDGTHQIEIEEYAKLLGVHIDSHLSFSHHVETIKRAANKKCHGLLLLKRAGVKQPSLVMLYKSQTLPTITHSSAAWYPYTTDYQQKDLEKSQKLALRIIFPEIESYAERLAAAGCLNTLNETLKSICRSYATKVKETTSHPLHDRLPKRPAGVRFPRRLRQLDLYIPKTRTVKGEKMSCVIHCIYSECDTCTC